MGSNRSMGAREYRREAHDSLDDFPTPPWAARAICEHLQAEFGFDLSTMTAWEPACNRGAFARGLADYFQSLYLTDVFDYGFADMNEQIDFTMAYPEAKDFILTNPPFRLAKEFIERALICAGVGCAFLVRNAFVEGESRYYELFSKTPPTQLLYFSERVVMLKGRLVRANEIDPIATATKGSKQHASTNRASMVAIWIKGEARRPCAWIGPGSRLRLERLGDYELPLGTALTGRM